MTNWFASQGSFPQSLARSRDAAAAAAKQVSSEPHCLERIEEYVRAEPIPQLDALTAPARQEVMLIVARAAETTCMDVAAIRAALVREAERARP